MKFEQIIELVKEERKKHKETFPDYVIKDDLRAVRIIAEEFGEFVRLEQNKYEELIQLIAVSCAVLEGVPLEEYNRLLKTDCVVCDGTGELGVRFNFSECPICKGTGIRIVKPLEEIL